MTVREYGASGPTLILMHGGPGAQGSMAPVARVFADSFHVLEPFQRVESTTVAAHAADLDELVQSRCAGGWPVIVGHSWGAMLTLAYAAEHPESTRALVLIASGTFDKLARDKLESTIRAKFDPQLRARFDRLERDFPDPNARYREVGRLLMPLYSFDLISDDTESAVPDYVAEAQASEASWNDMVRLQESGVYPAAFRAIRAPVLMLHGADDPHPGHMIRDSLAPHLPQLEYREWEKCGHYPWLERHARDEFFATLREWLARHRV